MVRALQRSIFGCCRHVSLRSISKTDTPRLARTMERVCPKGPAPSTRTSASKVLALSRMPAPINSHSCCRNRAGSEQSRGIHIECNVAKRGSRKCSRGRLTNNEGIVRADDKAVCSHLIGQETERGGGVDDCVVPESLQCFRRRLRNRLAPRCSHIPHKLDPGCDPRECASPMAQQDVEPRKFLKHATCKSEVAASAVSSGNTAVAASSLGPPMRSTPAGCSGWTKTRRPSSSARA